MTKRSPPVPEVVPGPPGHPTGPPVPTPQGDRVPGDHPRLVPEVVPEWDQALAELRERIESEESP
jgi:hypothetical protein